MTGTTNSNEKRLEISRARYYITLPLKRAGARIRRSLSRVRGKTVDRVTGRWYCEGCREYHAGRVVAFYLDGGLSDGCCYRHVTAEEIARCETIKIGGFSGLDITERVKREMLGGVDGETE